MPRWARTERSLLQLLIAFRGRNKEFLLQGILIHRIVIVGNSRTALMDPTVHSSVNDKVDSAVLIHRKDLDAMFRHIVPDIIGCRAAESEHSGSHISPLSYAHSSRPVTNAVYWPPALFTAWTPSPSPIPRMIRLSGEQIGISCEKFRHGPLVIHHVDPLGRPFHCEIFCHLVGFRLFTILRRHMGRDLHVGKVSGQFL